MLINDTGTLNSQTKLLENVEHCGCEPEQAATADLLFCHGAGFVTKSSPEINTSITCQPFLQPRQLTWVHMHPLSSIPKS